MIVKAMEKSGRIAVALVTLCLCAVVIIYSKSCCDGAVKGIGMCLNVLVPSLFPFMVLSSFIVKSGLSYTLGKPLGRITKALFGLDGCFAPVILLSLIGGYPVGAKGICTLYKQGTASYEQCKKASMIAVCSGAGFLINFVGMSLYENKLIGFVLLFAQVFSVFMLGVGLKIIYKLRGLDKDNYNSDTEFYSPPLPLGNAVVEATYDGAKGILSICAFVVLFSAITSVIGCIIGEGIFYDLSLVLLEVCSAVNVLSAKSSVEVVAFAIGFGGMCVHFQIFSSLGNIRINKLLFFCIRIIQGVITGLLTYIAMRFCANEKMVFSTAVVEHTDTGGGTVFAGIVLVLVGICFLYTLKNKTI